MKYLLPLLLLPVLSTQPIKAQSFDSQHSSLLSNIQRIGVDVSINHPYCNSGVFGAYFTDGSSLIICSKGDTAEQQDTIRHESWHLIQDLQDCSLQDTTPLKPIFPISAIPPSIRAGIANHYPPSVLDVEAEAFFVASTLPPSVISDFLFYLISTCS